MRTDAPYDKKTLIDLVDEYNPMNIYTEEISVEDVVSRLFAG